MINFGKRLDVYFIKDLIYRRAHEELAESLKLTIEQDDYISRKTLHKITRNYEECYNETIKLGKKEFRRIIRARKKKARTGEIDQNAEIAMFLQTIGVEFYELSNATRGNETEIEPQSGERDEVEQEVVKQETGQE